MNKLKIIFIAIFCLMTLKANAEAVTVGRVLAIVNNEAVTLSDYKKYILQTGSSASPETIDENLLKKLIDDKIILIEAKKNGIFATEAEISRTIKEFKQNNNFSDEELKKRLAESGLTITDYEVLLRENLINLKFMDRELDSKIIVTDKEINAYYKKNLKLFIDRPERMLVKAIFMRFSVNPTLTEITDLKIKSLKIISEIKKGEPFEKMIDLYADEPLKSQEGLLGEFESGALITELDQALSSLKEGEVSAPVWVKNGVYILKMSSKIKAAYIPLNQAREQIYAALYQQKREIKFNEWLKLLWEKSSVTIKK